MITKGKNTDCYEVYLQNCVKKNNNNPMSIEFYILNNFLLFSPSWIKPTFSLAILYIMKSQASLRLFCTYAQSLLLLKCLQMENLHMVVQEF